MMLPVENPVAPPINRVGFIGLGQMGYGMASNLLKRGFAMTLFAHRQRAAIDELVSQGAIEVRNAAAMASTCDVIVLCVANADQVQELVEGTEGIASVSSKHLVVLDCTTSSPERIVDLQKRHQNLVFVDAPLGRSPAEARQGRLSTLVGADTAVFERIRPVLDAFADTVQLIGPLGSGQKLKLVNNFVSLGYAALYSEALVLALKSGLTLQQFDDLIRTSRMNCQFFDTFMFWTLEGDSSSHRFSLQNADRTIRDVEQMGRGLGLESELAASVGGVYHRAIKHGMAQADLPELPRSAALDAGIDLRPLRGGPG
ncbi:MAG: NAD(P)-dependent oxidoreductase [Devosia sp.]